MDLRIPAFIFLIVFVLFAATDLYWQHQRTNFAENGVKVSARVLEKYKNRSGFHIKYTYTSADGAEYQGNEPFVQPEWESADINTAVPIVYLKTEPGTSISAYRLKNLGLGHEWKWLLLVLPLAASAICYGVYRYKNASLSA